MDIASGDNLITSNKTSTGTSLKSCLSNDGNALSVKNLWTCTN